MLLEVLGVVGLAIVIAMTNQVSDFDGWIYTGGFTLVSIVAASVVAVAAQTGGGNPIRWVVSLPPLPAIGRTSYGPCLWHRHVHVFMPPKARGWVVTNCCSPVSRSHSSSL